VVPLRKWYFAVDERGVRNASGLLRAAVISCRTHTSLAPHLLYYGAEDPFLDDLRALGVTVIAHTPSIERELRIGYGPEKFDQFVGHWLRLDLPDIETEDDFILYTDIDVVFRSLPPTLPAPALLSAGPAEERDERVRFNSGVMVLNLPALRTVWPEFMGQVRDRLLGDFRYPAHDQVSFNRFFAGRHDWIADEMNWRPYWGHNPSAHLLHYHGPKPRQIRRFMRGQGLDAKRYVDIWQRDPEAYATYVDLFESYAEAPGPLPADPPGTVMIDTSILAGPTETTEGPATGQRQGGILSRLFSRS
jgi:hypothetical protein